MAHSPRARPRSWTRVPRTSGSATPSSSSSQSTHAPPDRQHLPRTLRRRRAGPRQPRVRCHRGQPRRRPAGPRHRRRIALRPTSAASASIRPCPTPSVSRSRRSGVSASSTRRDRPDRAGVLEDRRFFLADETNRLVDRLVVPRARASIATPHEPRRRPTCRMTFPDGQVIEDHVRLADPIETPIHGRTGVGHVVDGPWAAQLSDLHRPRRSPSSAAIARAGRVPATR